MHTRFSNPNRAARSERARQILRWFGVSDARLTEPQPSHDPAQMARFLPADGQITLIVGPSGSGKSTLLRSLCAVDGGSWLDLDSIHLADVPVIDCFEHLSLPRTLRLMGCVGLAELWTCLRLPDELSDGQRWRLRLAMAIDRSDRSRPLLLACDEFAAMLDRVTAAVVARTLRRAIIAPARGIVATSHEDLVTALKPDRIARCDFGTVQIESGIVTAETANTARCTPARRTPPPARSASSSHAARNAA